VELTQQQQRGKAAPRDHKKIELGALLPTVCKRCGGQGHLASECFNVGGEKYELIPEPVGGDEVEKRKREKRTKRNEETRKGLPYRVS
jgi:hypothetical protein